MAITYTTGPMEQQGTGVVSVRVKVSNQSSTAVQARVRVFDLDGTKIIIGSSTFTVPALSSAFRTFSVAGTGQYEVEIRLSHNNKVFVSAWGRDVAGRPLAVHRVLHAEMTIKNDPDDGDVGAENRSSGALEDRERYHETRNA